MLKVFLEMNKSPRSLDQSLEKIVVVGVSVEPEMFEHIMSFIVALFVPAAKKCAIKWVIRDRPGIRINPSAFQIADELRNPLAFVHVGLNLGVAQMMSKPRGFIFAEGSPESLRGGNEK